MNWRPIGALVSKDFTLFFRNRFFAVITVLSLVMFPVIYFVMPSSVDETLEIGLYAPVLPPAIQQIQEAEDEGLRLDVVESEEALKKGVTEGRYVAGLALPADMTEKLVLGEAPEIEVYFASHTPEDFRDIIDIVITEMAYLQIGQPLDIDWQPEILGPDMAGSQIPQRDRLRPLFAVFILMTETFGLAGLLSEEVERRTAWALLVTPMTVKELFTAKGIVGVVLAFSQALLILAVVGGMGEQPLIMVIALLLGAVLVTGVAFLIASLGKDFLSVTAWGMPALIILSIPAFAILTPGEVSSWIKAIPSYYLTDTVYRVSNLGIGWSEVWHNLLILAGCNLVIVAAGILTLRRKFQ